MIIEDPDEPDSELTGQVTTGTSHAYTPCDVSTIPVPSTLGPQEGDTPLSQTSRTSPALQLSTPVKPPFTPESQADANMPQFITPATVSSIVTLNSQVPCLLTTSVTSPCSPRSSSPRSSLVTQCLSKSHPGIPRFITAPLSPHTLFTHPTPRPPRQRLAATRPHLLPPPPVRASSPILRTFHPGYQSRAFLTNPYPNPMYPTPSLGANYAAPPFPMCPGPVSTQPLWMSASSPAHGMKAVPGMSSAVHVSQSQSPVSS